MSKFSERLKEIRTEKGISSKQLADLLFVSDRSIRYWEENHHECNFDTLIKIAEILDTSTDYLLGKIDIEQ